MISIKNKLKTTGFVAAAALIALTSCNKDVEQFKDPNPAPGPATGLTLAQTLAATPSDSLFSRMIIKSGMDVVLNNPSLRYTLFVPSNTAVIASLGGSLATANGFIAANSATTLASIVKYNMVPQLLPTSAIVHNFPNKQMPTDIILDPTNPLVRMTSFPSKNPSTGFYYYNNAPFTAADLVVNNGVMHHTAFLVTPPQRVLKDTIGRVSNLTYFKAAITRGDSGLTGLNRLDSLLNYPVTNMTVMVPNDAAFQALIFGYVYNIVFTQTGSTAIATAQANGAVALGPAIFSTPAFYPILSATTVRGILAYHFLATQTATGAYQPNIRAFSVNFPTTATTYKTLVNGAVAAHPGVMAKATFTGTFPSALEFTSYGTFPPGGIPFSGPVANAVSFDRHAVNGVFHIIDKVLLPQ